MLWSYSQFLSPFFIPFIHYFKNFAPLSQMARYARLGRFTLVSASLRLAAATMLLRSLSTSPNGLTISTKILNAKKRRGCSPTDRGFTRLIGVH
jgi:hypothetical protein